jgi:hypothetical protein
MATIMVDRRFRGPARSGNGGYTAGLLAAALRGASGSVTATVTLRVPPPLETPLDVVPGGPGVRLLHGDETIAQAEPGEFTGPPTGPVPYEAAVAAAGGYRGHAGHPFPGCFACGPARAEGDGLRLFAGPVAGRDDTVAAPWTPAGGTVSEPVVWAALDCPGGWSIDLAGRPMVLGRMTGRVDALPEAGEPCVVVGHRRGVHGRKGFTDSALYRADGTLLAMAEATWIEVDPAVFSALR